MRIFLSLILLFILLQVTTSLNGQVVAGNVDTTFNPDDIGFGFGDGIYCCGVFVNTIAIQNDGRIIFGGLFGAYNGVNRNYITRVFPDGNIDLSFDPGSGASSQIHAIAIQNDGKILIGGVFNSYNGISRKRIARIHVDGSIDTTFNPGLGASSTIHTIAIQGDGKIIIGGEFQTYNGISIFRVARLNTDGSLDTSFSPGSGPSGTVLSALIQADGNIILTGEFTSFNGQLGRRIIRLNSDGSVDSTFGNSGHVGTNNIIYSSAIQADGKIVIGGNFTNCNYTSITDIARLNTDGTIDSTFNPGLGSNNHIKSVAIQNDGKIIVGGYFTLFNGIACKNIVRLHIDGTFDSSFNAGTVINQAVRSIAIQNNSKIIIGGEFDSDIGTIGNGISRLEPDGVIDTSFNFGSGANDDINTIAIQNDGKIIIGGEFTFYNGIRRNKIARIHPDGSLDNSFQPGTGFTGEVNALDIQSDGKIIVGGLFYNYNGASVAPGIIRLHPDGTRDFSFNPVTTLACVVYGVKIQNDGKILIAGDHFQYGGNSRNGIARLETNGTLDLSFNPGTGTNTQVLSLSIQSDGKIIAGGSFTSFNGVSRNGIARVNIDGTLDLGFDPGSGVMGGSVRTTSVQDDGKILIGGDFSSFNGTSLGKIARINPDGSLDTTFNTGTAADDKIHCLNIQDDGKIIIGGEFISFDSTGRNRIARLNNDISTGLTSLNDFKLKLYPNPNTGEFFVHSLAEIEMKVFNLIGMLVFEQKLIKGLNHIKLNNVTHGIYFANFSHDEEQHLTKIFVIAE